MLEWIGQSRWAAAVAKWSGIGIPSIFGLLLFLSGANFASGGVLFVLAGVFGAGVMAYVGSGKLVDSGGDDSTEG